jgi:hypothetical protein
MIKHLEKSELQGGYIIETGCTRIKDNWGGDGQSTRIWNWVMEKCPRFRAITIDITPEFIELSKELAPWVDHMCSDSMEALINMPRAILEQTRLLYLDSFDWNEEIAMDSAFHHVCELALVYKLLPEGCMIVVDDRHGTTKGKHTMVQAFFEKLNIAPVFAEYQIAWIKP